MHVCLLFYNINRINDYIKNKYLKNNQTEKLVLNNYLFRTQKIMILLLLFILLFICKMYYLFYYLKLYLGLQKNDYNIRLRWNL
jgi:hypothetical protein